VELSVTGDASGDLAHAAELIGRWDYPAARTVLTELVTRAGESGRWDQLDGLTARRMLADVLRELGDLVEAHELAAEVLDVCRQRYGDQHPATVRTLAVLATVLHERGELARARNCYEQVVADGSTPPPPPGFGPVRLGTPPVDGPAARAVLLARANLALLDRDEGDLPTAVRGLTSAYTLHRRAFGGGDLETIRLAAELGRLHSALGDRPNARRMLTLAYAGARGELGEEHPLTAVVEAALTEVEPPMPSAPEDEPKPPPGPSWRARRLLRLEAPRAPKPSRRTHRRLDPSLAGDLAEASTTRGLSRRARHRLDSALPGVQVAEPEPSRTARRRAEAAESEPADPFLTQPAGSSLARLAGLAEGPGLLRPPSLPRRSPRLPRLRHGRTGRRWRVLAIAGMSLGALLAIAGATIAVLTRPIAPSHGAVPVVHPAASTPAARSNAPPGDVTLRDDGTSVTVSWSDPSGGTGTVLLAVARSGQPAGPLQSLPPGTVEHRIVGLDPAADYCVVLAVVYGQDTMAQAAQVCTHRHVAPLKPS
jgi:hypothetical protein